MTGTDALAHVQEHLGLLTGPDVPEPIATRVRRLAGLATDLVEVDGDEAERLVDTAMTFVIERVGAYQRMPAEFAVSRPLGDERTELRRLVDDLDLLILHLSVAYDAASRGDQEAQEAETRAAEEQFASDSELGEVVPRISDTLDPDEVARRGLVIGEDGIPRMPVPERPDDENPSTDDGEKTP